MTPEEFFEALSTKGIDLSDTQKSQFETYFHELVETNKVMNLTSITEKEQVYLKHFYDSLILDFFDDALIKDDLSICDVGSGAGFPSIPLKIVNPNLQVTIIDSLNKRINFLNQLVDKLGLENVNLVHGRAEELGQNKQYRQSFDLVTARAVASMAVLTELCLPFVKKGGQFIAMKADKASEELVEAKFAITTLGGKFEKQAEFELPNGAGSRNLIFVSKTKETPKKYPRKPGTPSRKPLIK
ncbi:16S rRNA (guanine(527)-N(7))-methyltransferase RsmG [Companilactobacillus furfuricola]|uniref:16S rRNA (guanine(527)-N(7))-methyltransferase RsmG n=1 Tax=Companilactobacillus furfuricola TaxID=1462575 RepID=UPI000F78B39E|nr:16S rRNA (guanine(527)-N(7))-methyltransferase RsmG [Companilactobacillus furfuricola]